MNRRILYSKPSITDLELAYATDAVKNGWGENCYDYINKFENLFKDYTGVQYAISTSSCTGALHLGLAALGVGPGDEVILADTNWIASVAPITYLGAKPVFVDILPDTWCIDPDLAEAAISPKTKAIIAVHLYGNVCEMDRLMEISKKYKIPIIEDAAEAIGSFWKGRHAGSIGAFGIFSFHGTKTITTGEGGMFITNDCDLYEKVLTLSNHGRIKGQKKQFWPEVVGYKYKMSNVQAAIGCAQIERIQDLLKRKREIFKYYEKSFSEITAIRMNPEKSGTVNGYWMPTIVFSPETGVTREKMQAEFKKQNVDARVFFWPLSSLPMFTRNYANKNSYLIQEYAINLPSYHDMTVEDQKCIIDVVFNLIK
jgi:perosamine synthetase